MRAALLRELGFRLPAGARIALVGPDLDAAAVRAAHPDAQVFSLDGGDPRPLTGPNLDLIVCAELQLADLPLFRAALRPGGGLLLETRCIGAQALREALEGAGLEVSRVGPASTTGLGLRARAGLGGKRLVARALRHPGTGQH